MSFSISYLDKNEAIFVLGLMKNIHCTHCPDFFKGCSGGPTLQECAMLSDQQFIDCHISGTEGFLCGKLRNIISLSKAEEQEISNNFEKNFNKRISILTKKNDNGSYVIVYDRDEFDNVLKEIERKMFERMQCSVEKVNNHNITTINSLQEKISHQNQLIKDMQETIKKLKNKNEI